MKKLLTILIGLLIILSGCTDENPDGNSGNGKKTMLTINNQSDINIIDVNYASVDFGSISKGERVSKEIDAGTRYIYFSFMINSTKIDCRTDVFTCEEGENTPFNITNFTTVTDTGNNKVDTIRNIFNALSSFPGNLRIASVTENSITLTWNNVNGASGYNFYRSTSQNGIYTKLNVNLLTENEFIDSTASSGVNYWYTVTTMISGLETVRAESILATTLLPAPTGVLISAFTDTTVSIVWNNVTGAASYNVYRSTTENGSYLKVNINTVAETSYTDTGLSPKSSYYYYVCAVSNGIEGTKSTPPISVTTLVAAPTGVNATAASAISITVTWNPVGGAISYKVYYTTGSAAGNKILVNDSAIGTSFIHSGLQSGTNYYYFIVAVTDEGDSSYSLPALGILIPSVPTGVNATANSTTSIIIMWNPVLGAASYKIYYVIGSSINKILAATVFDTSFNHTGLQTETSYTYYIVASNSAGDSDFSSAASAITLMNMPDAPTGVNATATSSASITVSWNPALGALAYKIFYEEGVSTTKILAGQVNNETSYTHTGLQSNTAYRYYVVSSNSAGDSGYSSSATATTLPAAPTGVSATAVSTSSISVSWNPVSGASNYKVYYTTGSSSGSKILAGTVTGTSYTHNNLTAGTTYFYFIIVVVNSRDSDYSSFVQGLPLPGVPVGLNTSNATTTSINLTWNAVSGTVWYEVYYATSQSGAKTLLSSSVYSASYTHNAGSTASGNTYYYFVIAANSSGKSDYSSSVAGTFKPGMVTGGSGSAQSTTSIRISWSPVNGATGYKIYYTTGSSSGSKILAGTVTGNGTTSFTHSNLPPVSVIGNPSLYYYWIAAENSAGEGAQSGSVFVILN